MSSIVKKFILSLPSLPSNIQNVPSVPLTDQLQEELKDNSIILSVSETLTDLKLEDVVPILNSSKNDPNLDLTKLMYTYQSSIFFYIILHILHMSTHLSIEDGIIELKGDLTNLNTCGDVIKLLPNLRNQGSYHYPHASETILLLDTRKKGVIQELFNTTFMKKKIERMKIERKRANLSDTSKIINYLELMDEINLLQSTNINKYKHKLLFYIGDYTMLNDILTRYTTIHASCDGAWTPSDC